MGCHISLTLDKMGDCRQNDGRSIYPTCAVTVGNNDNDRFGLETFHLVSFNSVCVLLLNRSIFLVSSDSIDPITEANDSKLMLLFHDDSTRLGLDLDLMHVCFASFNMSKFHI